MLILSTGHILSTATFSGENMQSSVHDHPGPPARFPSVFCLTALFLACTLLYWKALLTWFQGDDMNWLNLHLGVRNGRELWNALFTPMAQGTVRPLSERAYFIGLSSVFGINPLPFRILAFATQFANFAFLWSIALRLTGSRAASLISCCLWMLNIGLVTALSWNSTYNQILCAFFLLASFRLLLSYLETNSTRSYIAMWLTFLLGFGALELMIVFPVLAATYTAWHKPEKLRPILFMFVASVAYGLLHLYAIPKAVDGPYRIRFDSRVFETLATYWATSLGSGYLARIGYWPRAAAMLATALLTIGLVVFTLRRCARRDWLPSIAAIWFLVLMAPYVVLPDHISDYYLAVPVSALALVGGYAVWIGWQGNWVSRATTLALLAMYAVPSLIAGSFITSWYYERGLRVRNLIHEVVEIHRQDPAKAILLRGIDNDLFWAAIFGKPFQLYGISNVYLAPGEETRLRILPEWAHALPAFVLSPEITWEYLQNHQASVYELKDGSLVEATEAYDSEIRDKWDTTQFGRRVLVGQLPWTG